MRNATAHDATRQGVTLSNHIDRSIAVFLDESIPPAMRWLVVELERSQMLESDPADSERRIELDRYARHLELLDRWPVQH